LSRVIAGENTRIPYEYDFGDGWEHELLVERVFAPEPGVHYPVCLEGERNCPPEDVGGTGGYEDFLEAIRNRRHPEHRRMLEWVGGDFDPEGFYLIPVNDKLRRFKGGARLAR
jgi:hypothetical protein